MKKKSNYFTKLLLIFFILFIFFYALTRSGYYESNLARKTILTEKKIREFENDINEGKIIDIDNYYIENKKDYSSFASELGKNISQKLSKGLKSIFYNSGRILKKLF